MTKRKAKSRAGRPTKLTKETQEKICLALRGGNFRSTAAQWAGVSYRVFMDWMKSGKAKPDSAHGGFRRAVIESEKAAEIHAVGLIVRAAAQDPKHAEWWLSHRHSERWADRARMEMRQHAKVEVTTRELEHVSLDKLTRMERLLAEPDPITH